MEKQNASSEDVQQIILDLKPKGLFVLGSCAAISTLIGLGLKKRNSTTNLLKFIPNTTVVLFGTSFGFLLGKELLQRKTNKYEMVEFSKLSGLISGAVSFGALGLVYRGSNNLLPLITALFGASFGYMYVWTQEQYILWKYSNWKKKQQGEVQEVDKKNLIRRFMEAVPDYFKDPEIEYAIKRREELEFIKQELQRMEQMKEDSAKKEDFKKE